MCPVIGCMWVDSPVRGPGRDPSEELEHEVPDGADAGDVAQRSVADHTYGYAEALRELPRP